MPEITDSMKEDLGVIICPQMDCPKRGDFYRCYIDIYTCCPRFTEKGDIPCHISVDTIVERSDAISVKKGKRVLPETKQTSRV